MFFGLISSNSILFSGAFVTSFLLILFFGKIFIPIMKTSQRLKQPIRTDGIKAHIDEKVGTPTMGGILTIIAILISSFLFMDSGNLISWIPLIAMVSFGIIGLIDDLSKLKRQNSYGGMSGWGRLATGGVISIILTFMIDSVMPAYLPPLSIVLPFGIIIPLGIFYFVWSYFVITGTANAANLTDGQDGLLSKVLMPVIVVMIIALIGLTRVNFMPNLIYLPEAAALFPIFGGMTGAILGFLWFNSKPASIFTGDVGSYGLGALLGTCALLMKSEIIMAVASGVMVIVVISSFMQMMYYKFIAPKGKAPFLMAPLHHHYEKKGIPETKITERFFIASIIFAGIAIALLKL